MTAQARLIEPQAGDRVQIETDGRVLRPAIAPLTTILSECKLTFGADRVETTAVDSANVAMVRQSIHTDAFERYDCPGELTVGCDLEALQTALSFARLGKQTRDPLSLEIDPHSVAVSIDREYDTTTVTRTDEFLSLDPGAIREEPDLPELNLHATAEVDVDAFIAAVQHADDVADHVRLLAREGDLYCQAADTTTDGDDTEVREGTTTIFTNALNLDEDAEEPRPAAMYSLDYVTDVARGLKRTKVDTVEIAFDEEFPMQCRFERTDDDDQVLYDGEFMVAPRISGDGPNPAYETYGEEKTEVAA